MNMLHVRYAVEVAKTGSINAASKSLMVAQPNISRSIKELEENIGITLFTRNAKGMILTAEGADFINDCRKILGEIDRIENTYKNGLFDIIKNFAVSVPKSGYISEAFSVFASKNKNISNLVYREASAITTIRDIISGDFKLGIIRYPVKHDTYYKDFLDENDLYYELVSEFRYKLITHRESEIAGNNTIDLDSLKDYTEICHADPLLINMKENEYVHHEFSPQAKRHINVFGRASAFEFLTMNEDAFMWAAPMPRNILERYNLVQMNCPDDKLVFKDVLIYKNDYALNPIDKAFVTELCNSRRRNLG
ncbi:MAG: LysR family transcriptional regulator [Clostridia bacterium]|nr:LysR family transcriptional regulator [Clostridia bacterium]